MICLVTFLLYKEKSLFGYISVLFMLLILNTKYFVWVYQENANINMFGSLFYC